MTNLSNRTQRRAVTLVEVVFAIGVVLIGLLGLISILPLAGRRAQDAIDLNVGAVMGEQVLKELRARRYLSNGRLKPLPSDTSDLPLAGIDNLDVDTTTSFCIDPIFASSSTPPAPPTSTANTNGYSRTAFPFYRPTHHPLIDPSTNSIFWPVDQPRLTRVGIIQTGNAAEEYLTTAEALSIVENPDDLLVTRPEDRTRNATFEDSEIPAITSGGLPYGARIPRGEYTWIATVNPLPGGVYASVSIVIMKKRERNFEVPIGVTPAETPQRNAIGERIAYVTYGAGFTGGAGGVVHLVSADNTVPKILANDWIMLSRNTTGAAGGPFIHRWYRVIAVNNDPERFTTDGSTTADDTNLGARLPGGSNDVWRHRLLLEGPDWTFGHESSVNDQYADNTFANNTYATILSDVVSVTERTVLMTDL